jgi:endonuclease YncB( thermonuclease family)
MGAMRMRRYLLSALAGALLLLAGAPPPAHAGGAITGKAFVIDGGTLEVSGKRIHLFGIDAPDRAQTCLTKRGGSYPCGLRAAFALDNLAKGKPVSCDPRGVDSALRIIATCSYNGLDIGGAMIEAGWAIADVRYSDAYLQTEKAAAAAGEGLWQGQFEEPAVWRQRKKTESAAN